MNPAVTYEHSDLMEHSSQSGSITETGELRVARVCSGDLVARAA